MLEKTNNFHYKYILPSYLFRIFSFLNFLIRLYPKKAET